MNDCQRAFFINTKEGQRILKLFQEGRLGQGSRIEPHPVYEGVALIHVEDPLGRDLLRPPSQRTTREGQWDAFFDQSDWHTTLEDIHEMLRVMSNFKEDK